MRRQKGDEERDGAEPQAHKELRSDEGRNTIEEMESVRGGGCVELPLLTVQCHLCKAEACMCVHLIVIRGLCEMVTCDREHSSWRNLQGGRCLATPL